MANCDLKEQIFSNIDVMCDVTTGFEAEAVFVLRADVDFASLKKAESASTQPNTYLFDGATGGTGTYNFMKAGKTPAIVCQLKNAFSGTTAEMAEGDIRNTITNTVAMNIWSNDPKSAKQIDDMLNSTYVCILKQNYKGDTLGGNEGLAKYRVFGTTGSGLKMTACNNDAYNDSIGNGWTVTFQETGASRSAMFISAKDTQGFMDEGVADTWFEGNFGEFRSE